MWPIVIALAGLAVSVPPAENLLANPGFEELRGEQPERWEVFVQPREGVTGRVSTSAHTGAHAVMLHTPTPYEIDPANNWSQSLIGDFAGKRLRLTAQIRTEEAEDAAIWLQCWRKQPWGVARTISTSEKAPMYGTRDWEEVHAELDVPEGTDFLMVRCVLRGAGTAWFDEVVLREVGEAPRPKPTESPVASAPATASTPAPGVVAPPGPVESAAADKPLSNAERMRLEGEVRRLREENEMLRQTTQGLRQSNEQLKRDLDTVTRGMRQLNRGAGISGVDILRQLSPAGGLEP